VRICVQQPKALVIKSDQSKLVLKGKEKEERYKKKKVDKEKKKVGKEASKSVTTCSDGLVSCQGHPHPAATATVT
jgi:hypothetical protein